MEEQILDAWRTHNRINLYLLDALAPEAMSGVSTSKGRNVAEQFAHIHNVRLMWLKPAAPKLLTNLPKLEKGVSDKALLRGALEASGQAIESLLQQGMSAGGKITGFKPHLMGFLSYLISHEAYHRAEIGIILTQSGHQLDQKTAYGLWDWAAR